MSQRNYPVLGAGLRTPHYSHLLQRPPTRMDWFEAISENFMNSNGRPMQVLETVRKDYPVALHGVSMSIASPDGIDLSYLRCLRALIDRIQPFLVSDHLCFSRYGHYYLHDLLPFPLTGEALEIVCRNVDAVQNFLGRRIALENASVYLAYPGSGMSEAEFLASVVERTGAGVLLDLNNLYVNQRNVGNDPAHYFECLPGDAILQMHLAGYSDPGSFYFDTHSAPVYPAVWQLFATAMRLYPLVPVCIEWDENIPEFSVLEEEVDHARRIRRDVIAEDRDYVGFFSMHSNPYADLLRRPDPGRSPVLAPCLIELDSPGSSPSQDRAAMAAPAMAGVQKAFCRLLLSGSPDVKLPVAILPAGELSIEDALLVYAGGYLARREEAILENYRGTAWLLGAPRFYELVHRYLADNFSTEYDLNRYGRQFWRFLKEQAGTDNLLVLAAEMARLDQTFVDVFHRPAGSPVDPVRLAALSREVDVHLTLNPSVEVLCLESAVYDLWKDRGTEVRVESGIGDRDPGSFGGSERIALYRREDHVVMLRLQPWQKDLLLALKEGGSLSDCLASIRADEAEGPTVDGVRDLFSLLAREGIITDVQILSDDAATSRSR